MTKATLTGLLGGLMAVVALASPARAAEEAAAPRAFAVLVGISKYEDKNIEARPHAEADVKALYDVLTDKGYLGLEKDRVRLLLGGEADAGRNSQPATKENILKAAQWVATEAKRDDLVIFAFVGQGAALGERGDRIVYLAKDSTVKDMAKDAVPAAALGEELDKLKSRRFAALVDVYYKGYTPAGGGNPTEPNLGTNFYKEFLGEDGTEEGAPAPGRVLVLATTGRVLSPDLDKHGSFAHVVLDALKGKADTDGYEADGVVTVDELTEHLNKELPPLVRKHGGPDKDRTRHAVVAGEDAHFWLTQNPGVMANVKARLEKFEKLTKEDAKLTPDVALEGKRLLEKMPKLESQQKLRKEYQALADGKVTVDKFLTNRAAILEGQKLSRDVAVEFSRKVLDATKTILRDYVKEVNQGEMVGWAIRGLYRKIDEKVPEDVAKQLANVKEMKERDLRDLLIDVRMRLGNREDLDKHKDIDNALMRMLNHLDPYTTFYDPESLEREKGQIQGRFIGVGIQIRKDSNTDMIQVITPIMGSPAYRAGIQAGDLITTVTREVDSYGKPLEPAEVISTKGLDISEAVKKILGKEGTRVKLTVNRPGEEKPIEFELVRRPIQVETVLGFKRKADANWEYMLDAESKIGYVRLTQFTRGSLHDMVRVMEDLKKQGVKGLVLDLRFNPGGLLDSARDITDLFIEDGLIVTIRPRVGAEYPMSGRKEGSYLHEGKYYDLPSHTDFPMVCMVNGLSASGSEIVSAALQDHGRALIVGERSYGKGSVQNVVDFEKEGPEVKSQIKLTTASFWRPTNKNLNKSSTSGKDTDEWGVVPCRAVPLTRAERDDLYEHQRNVEIIQPRDKPPSTEEKVEFKDKQLDVALEYLRGQIKTATKTPAKKAG
jgi:C-terminal peptidase prc